jgi:hypothetical protein
MKKSVIALFIITCCLHAHGQFFSEEEKSTIDKEKKAAMKKTLPEAEQKTVYLDLCAAEDKASAKAMNMHPVKIHQTPEKREEQQKKADKTKENLLQHYRKEVARKHQVTEDCLARIEAAGKQNHWPRAAKKPDAE